MIVTGILAGIAQTIIGYPIDTLKTNIQLYKPKNNINFIKKNISRYGFLHLYKGVLIPCSISIISNIYLFSSFEYFHKKYDTATAGFIVGGFTGFITNPFELIKCNVQTTEITLLQMLKKLKKEKIPLYKGLNFSFLRESIGCSIYFSSFHFLEEKTNYSMLNGGCAGVLSWLFTYPIDTMKTQLQVNNKFTYNNLYKGFSLVLIRSFLVNSIVFQIYKMKLD